MRRSAGGVLFFAGAIALAAGFALAWLNPIRGVWAQTGTGTGTGSGPAAGYVDPKACAGCHPSLWETYRRTGMGRSFYRPSAANLVEDYTKTYFHAPSGTSYAMVQHDGGYYQLQYQFDFDGKQTNVAETEIDFIVGSGNHSRTYLHRTRRNTLVELPLAWYAEKGGYWAMNPGYDRPDHQGRRRVIGYDCMFCHNAYPGIPAEKERAAEPVFSSVGDGIDCQRCHGPGERHVALARQPGKSRAEIRAAIVNPARLAANRQFEVCLQCHLETTSFPLPNSIVRYDRAPFSYRPGEPLGEFVLHFDQAPGHDREPRFEIAGSAYQLQRSACFQKSQGGLQCTTCHNPHDVPRGEAASRHYAGVCRQCHGAAFDRVVAAGRHTPAAECTGCHMPKRRTSDVVHVVMTDHFIQRRIPAGDLVADLSEQPGDADPYRGEVVLYYPKTLPRPEDELYLAVAQVKQQSNLAGGIGRLEAAIEKYRPSRPEFYLQLADAWRAGGKPAQALPFSEEALRRSPNWLAALQTMALCLMSLREQARAVEVLKQALLAAPGDAATWDLLGTAYVEQGNPSDAVAAFQKAIEQDDTMPEGYNGLGAVLLQTHDLMRAEPALRRAIALEPDYAQADNNLANLLSATGRFPEALYHFDKVLRTKPDNSAARYDYAVALARAGRREEAQQQIETALQSDPNSANAHEFLGTLLAANRQLARAIEHYREAVRLRPEFSLANLHLGESLADSGDLVAALPFLQKAAASPDRAIREEALGVLKTVAAGH